MAHVRSNRVLTKCGVVVTPDEAVAFDTDCPDCQVKKAWPSQEQQKKFARLRR
jgi:hypothetical protein